MFLWLVHCGYTGHSIFEAHANFFVVAKDFKPDLDFINLKISGQEFTSVDLALGDDDPGFDRGLRVAWVLPLKKEDFHSISASAFPTVFTPYCTAHIYLVRGIPGEFKFGGRG